MGLSPNQHHASQVEEEAPEASQAQEAEDEGQVQVNALPSLALFWRGGGE